jgi:hypothetical protein
VVQDFSARLLAFFAAYFVFVALMFPVLLMARKLQVAAHVERRLVQTLKWLALLIPLGGLAVLTLAYYLTPNT